MAFEVESNNTQATANILTSGPSLTGQVSSSSDVDWYKFIVTGPGVVTFSLDLASTNFTSYSLELYDTLGVLQRSYSTSRDGSYSVQAASAGAVYAKVSSYSGRDDYQIGASSSQSVTIVEVESNNTQATANILTSGPSLTGQVSSSSDVDWYKFIVTGPGVVTFSLDLASTNFTSYSLELYDTLGVLQRSYSTSSDGSYSVQAASAGAVYAKVSSYSGRDDYQIGASSSQSVTIVEVESNNTQATANILTSGPSLTGQVSSSSDVDWYKFIVTGPGVVTFSLDLASTNFTSYSLELYDTLGVLQRSYSTSSDGSYSVQAASAGAVYAKVSSYSGRDDYQIGASSSQSVTIVEVESNNTQATANILTSGPSLTGQVSSSSDVDWYKFIVTGPGVVTFSLDLASTNFTSYSLELYDTLGVLQRSYSTSSDGSYSVQAASAGAVYAKVSSYSGRDDYQIGASSSQSVTIVEVESNNTQATANILTSGPSLTGQVSSSSDVDWYKFIVTGPGVVTFSLDLASTNFTSYSLELYDTLGVLQRSYSTSSDGSYSVQAASAGAVYAKVSSYSGRDDYQIGANSAAAPPTPTYSVNANQSSVNEGSTATFTLATTNVASGTALAYTLSGLSASDITSGSLSGTTTVGSNGQATISIGIVADNVKDGSETLTVSVAGVSASTFVVDSSRPTAYPYEPYQNILFELVAGGTLSADRELASINATILSTPWTLVGFQSGSDLMHLWRTDNALGTGRADYNPPAASFRSGSGVIAPATPTEYILYDTATGRLYFDQDGTGPSPTTWVATFTDKPTLRATDFQISQPQTYAIAADGGGYNEGATASFTVTTTNVSEGTVLAYTLSGVSASDITGGSLSGTTTVGANGKATIAVGLVADNQKDGSETLSVSVAGVSASTFVVDSSRPTAYPYEPYQNILFELVAGGTLSADRELASINATILSTPWTLVGFQSGSDLMHLWRTDNALGTGRADYNPPAASFRSGSGVIAPATPTEYILYDTATGRLYFDQDGTGPSPTTWVATFTDKPTLRATDFQISQPQTYAIAADGGGYNEGATASFTVTTTNVSEGTVLAYTLSGVSASDITGGSLSGITTVGSNGQAIISVPIAADQTTEGNETLTVTAEGKTASITVVDSSKAVGLLIYGSLGIDFLSGGVEDDYLNGGEGNDRLWGNQGADTLVGGAGNDELWGEDGSRLVTIGNDFLFGDTGDDFLSGEGGNDTLYGGDGNDYLEGFFGDDYLDGGEGNDRIWGNQGADTLIGGAGNDELYGEDNGGTSLAGDDVLLGGDGDDQLFGEAGNDWLDGGNGNDFARFNGRADEYNWIEGTLDKSLVITDLVQARDGIDRLFNVEFLSFSDRTIDVGSKQKIEFISPTASAFTEGSTATFAVATSNVASGTSLTYTLSGVSASDITGGLLSGTTTVGSNGLATISIPLAADRSTEGDETLTVTVEGKTASVAIKDTSINALGSFGLLPAAATVNEGANATFYIVTDTVSAGLEVPYAITGVSASDVVGGQLSGTAVIGSNGEATIAIPLAADRTTEGDETLTVTVQAKTSSVMVKDTSTTPPATYDLKSSASTVDEGSAASFVLTTQNVAANTVLAYTISGLDKSDITGGALTGSVTVGSDGRATLSVPLLADQLTEGEETLTVSLKDITGVSASVKVQDTSLNPKISALFATPSAEVAAGKTLDIGTHELVLQAYTPNPTAGSLEKFGITGRNIMDAFNLYGILGRDPDPTGLGYWIEQIEEGRKQQSDGIFNDAIFGFISSAEFTDSVNNYLKGSTKSFNRGAVEMLYHNVLERDWAQIVNDPGVGYLASEIDNGNRTLVSVAKQIVISAEAYNHASYVINKRNISFVTWGTLGGNHAINGTDGPNALDGGDGNDTMSAAAGNDVVRGFGGDDFLVGGLGDDSISGGTGNDTVSFEANYANFDVSFTNGSYRVKDAVGALGTDQVTDVEWFKFLDRVLPAAQAISPLPTYAVSTTQSSLNEGQTAVFSITTQNVRTTTDLTWQITGLAKEDIEGGALTGTVRVDAQGKATVMVTIRADLLTENTETLNFTLGGKSASIAIADTSPSPDPPTYAIAANQASVNEGDTVSFTVTTTNVASGTTLSYTITGVSATDITGGSLSGTVQIGTDGRAQISVPLSADKTTEGPETLTVSLQGKSASVAIADTSLTPDTTAPKLLFSTPASGATSISVTENFVFVFDEPIKLGTGQISLVNATTGATFETFLASSSSRLVIKDNVLTIDPMNDLVQGTKYRLVFVTGAITDLQGNNYSPLQAIEVTTIGQDSPPPGF